MDHYEIVVVGGGVAGLTAGLFAARFGRSTLVVLSGAPGGHLLNIEHIATLPGFPEGTAGYDFCPTLQEQASDAGAEFEMAEVLHLEARGDGWLLTTEGGQLQAAAVIMATGCRPRALGVPGEKELYGRGVSHCASCDGPLYRGRRVAVIGGGDSALQEALTVADHAEQTFVIHRGPGFTAQSAFQRAVVEHPRIVVQFSTVVEAILGDEHVTGLRTRQPATGEGAELAVAGVFVYIGLEPNTELVRGLLDLDSDGRIPTDAGLRTALPGLYAAGDVRRDAAGQAIAAAGDGATAAISAHRALVARADTR